MRAAPVARAAALAVSLVASLAASASAQADVTFDATAGPSLTRIGASGTVEVVGLPVPIGRVDFPAAVGVDARVRLGVSGRVLGGRVGVGYLSASDVFDGASLFDQRSVDAAFAVASAELTVRRPLGGPLGEGEVVLGVGPEVRALLDAGDEVEGLVSLLGDVRRGHLAVGASASARFRVGGLVVGPEARAGLALTPLSDDTVDVLGGRVRLDGAFRFDHASLGLTVGVE